jgi:Dna[CI] antecedent, DciA
MARCECCVSDWGFEMSESNQGPENIGDILARLFTARGWGRKNERLRLEGAWAEAAGEQLVKDTRLLAMRRGVMEIEVRNAVLIQELTQFHKRGLLGKLRKSLPGLTLTDIKFRAGVW